MNEHKRQAPLFKDNEDTETYMLSPPLTFLNKLNSFLYGPSNTCMYVISHPVPIYLSNV